MQIRDFNSDGLGDVIVASSPTIDVYLQERTGTLQAIKACQSVLQVRFPVKIRGASAGWTRAVAIFDDALVASA